ncbi:hypothetical protein FBZ98_1011095 [Rhizobium sp. ERR 922]|nr:hypothetical protein FBZ98_1011095 [Rhizobium sp. ERR 922]TWC04675.1 hypothetical protein FBZ97_1011095 [Rhizobium sp. ERR 942]
MNQPEMEEAPRSYRGASLFLLRIRQVKKVILAGYLGVLPSIK